MTYMLLVNALSAVLNAADVVEADEERDDADDPEAAVDDAPVGRRFVLPRSQRRGTWRFKASIQTRDLCRPPPLLAASSPPAASPGPRLRFRLAARLGFQIVDKHGRPGQLPAHQT